MKATNQIVGSIKIVRVQGHLDAVTEASFASALEGFYDSDTEHLVIDMEGVSNITSAGMRVLVRAARERFGVGSLSIAHLQPPVKKIIDIAGFRRILGIFDDVEQAIASLDPNSSSLQRVGGMSDASDS